MIFWTGSASDALSPQHPPSGVFDALDDAPCALARTASDGLFIRVNTTFCEWLGYSADELVGRRKVQDLLTMGGKIFHQAHWAPLLQMQGSVSEVRLEMIQKNGGLIPMILNAIRRERDGACVHDLAAFWARDRDKFEQELIASRKKLELAIQEATALEEIAKDRALFAEQMMGIVSHDLRTPLSTIAMSARILSRSEQSANQPVVLARITRAAARADRLITDLLDFTQARLGTGLAVKPKLLNPHAAVADTVDELTQAFVDRALVHVKEGGHQGRADADRLAQIVVNLVANAMAYGDENATVTVASRSHDGFFSVSVHNFGKPIPVEARDALFRPLVRGEQSGAGSRSVGLGLYIVSEIAKAHGGSVQVASSEESGTLFTVLFPD